MTPAPIPSLPHAPAAAGSSPDALRRDVRDAPDTLFDTPPNPSSLALPWWPTLPHWADSLGAPDDGAAFARAASPAAAGDAAGLDRLGTELGALLACGPDELCEPCTFQLTLPGWGRMEGRMSAHGGRAQLELHAARPQLAALLRSRQHELQQAVEHSSQGDVNLLIF